MVGELFLFISSPRQKLYNQSFSSSIWGNPCPIRWINVKIARLRWNKKVKNKRLFLGQKTKQMSKQGGGQSNFVWIKHLGLQVEVWSNATHPPFGEWCPFSVVEKGKFSCILKNKRILYQIDICCNNNSIFIFCFIIYYSTLKDTQNDWSWRNYLKSDQVINIF